MEQRDLQAELGSVRSMMDRSTKFVAVSGVSVIMAGVYALVGTLLAWAWSGREFSVSGFIHLADAYNMPICVVAIGIMALSVLTSIGLTVRKAAGRGEKIWYTGKRGIVTNMALPLLIGVILIFIHLYRGETNNVIPASLIFYGLALVASSNYTVSLIRFMGYGEVIFGLLAALYPQQGVCFWIGGFALLNIVSGSIIYMRYER